MEQRSTDPGSKLKSSHQSFLEEEKNLDECQAFLYVNNYSENNSEEAKDGTMTDIKEAKLRK